MANKKNWIFLKRGLSQDAKHREAMANRIWLYLHILDRADWETGTAYDWRDKPEADDMGLNWRTLQRQRQELHEAGYITCHMTGNGLDIIVHNWTNPRNYSGEIINKRPAEYAKMRTLSTQESTQESTQPPYSDLRTPSIYPHKSLTTSQGDTATAIDFYHQNISPITPFIADSIQCAIDDYGLEWVMAALKETADNGKHNWKYTDAILRRCKEQGVPPGKGNKPAPAEPKSVYRDLSDIIPEALK